MILLEPWVLKPIQQVYNYAKASGQTGGLDTVVEEMGQRFARKSRKAKTPTAAL